MKLDIKTKFKSGDKVYYIHSEYESKLCEHCENGRIPTYSDPKVIEGVAKVVVLQGSNYQGSGLEVSDTTSVGLAVIIKIDDGEVILSEDKCFATREEAEAHINDKEYINKW